MSRQLQALVIGNGDYKNAGKLKNPMNDARDIATRLQALGFTVDKLIDCTHQEMDHAISRFGMSLKGQDVALFFFAGHGLQIEGENYLTATDTKASCEVEVKHSSLKLNYVIDLMERADTQTSIIILDACRDNPFERSWSRSASPRGLAPVYAPRGTLIAFATSPGQVASDGAGRNGSYTAALLEHISTPDCSIESMFKRVRNTLSAATHGRQISWEHTSLSGEFFFNLSLSTRIDLYSEEALMDKLFVLDDGKNSHRVIKALKSLTWPTQNPAIDRLTGELASKASVDSLFVLGRNIYQAACGGSRSARQYIDNFPSRTKGMPPKKRNALLHGMLFEMFFDPSAKLRTGFKLGAFISVFALQEMKTLSPSFEFIAECLLPDIHMFHMLPGKRHTISVDVVISQGSGMHQSVVDSIHFGGADILWLEDQDYAVTADETPRLKRISQRAFEKMLATQMVVPPHLLTVKYIPGLECSGDTLRISFPLGWTARKR